MVVLGGEQAPDAALMELSTVPMGVAADAHVYLAQGWRREPPPAARVPVRHRAADRGRLRAAGRAAHLGCPAAAHTGRRRGRHPAAGRDPVLPGPADRGEHRVRAGPGRRRRRGRWHRRTDLRRVPARRPGGPAGAPRHAGRAGDHRAGRRRDQAGHRQRRWRRRRVGRPGAGRLGHPDPAGPVPDLGAGRLDRFGRGHVPAGRGHPGRRAGVRRPDHHGAVLLQGDRRRRSAALRPRPRALHPGGRDRGQPRPAAPHPGGPAADRAGAVGVPDQALQDRQRRRSGHPGLGDPVAAGDAGGGLRPGRSRRDPGHRRARAGRRRAPRHHGGQRAHPRPDRGRRTGPGVADQRAAGGTAGQDRGGHVRALAGRPAR